MPNALSYAVLAYVVAVVAAVFGFGVPFESIAYISRVTFVVAIILFVVLLVAALTPCRCVLCKQYSRQDKSKGKGAANG